MHYSVNDGQTQSAGVEEWKGGERYGDTHDDYYAELRGTVTGTEAGDEVEVWFSGRKRGAGQVTSEHFTYQVHDDIGGDVLILAVEDVTGISPAQPGFTSAKYADEMAAALTHGRAHQRRLRLRHPGPEGPASPRRAVAPRRGAVGDRGRHHPAGAGAGGAGPR